MKKYLIYILLVASVNSYAQRTTDYVDLTAAAAKFQGAFALSYVHLWSIGKSQKFKVGVGGRFTTYVAANQYYATAPAQLTSESTSPAIIFKDNIIQNIDTFLIKTPLVNLFNVSINFQYQVFKKITAGFNIDAIGFSFGGIRTGNYINGPSGKIVDSSPTNFNLLLVSDNDRGSLNSEFFIGYQLNKGFSVKAGAQFLFTEYTTKTKVQQFPEPNDRFRNKSLLFSVGVSKRLFK